MPEYQISDTLKNPERIGFKRRQSAALVGFRHRKKITSENTIQDVHDITHQGYVCEVVEIYNMHLMSNSDKTTSFALIKTKNKIFGMRHGWKIIKI